MRVGHMRWALPLTGFVVLVGVGCERPAPPPPAVVETPEPLPYVPKCPDEHPWRAEFKWDSAGTVIRRTLATIPLAGERTSVFEAHDCQRLVVAGTDSSGKPSLRYGPLAMIFASDSLPALFGRGASSSSPGRAAAIIYSWSTDDPQTGNYDPLGIKGGWNCLYLFGQGANIKARMVPAYNEWYCLQPPKDSGTALRVLTRTPPSGLSAADIPAVARWDGKYDKSGAVHQIWIRCGNMACLVGPEAGFTPGAGIPAEIGERIRSLGVDDPRLRRVLEFRGWYDQQLLAVPAAGGLAVSPVLATLIPHPQLDAWNDPAYFESWRTVAFAYLPEGSPHYATKLNLEKGLNVISLLRGPKPEGAPSSCDTGGGEADWWIRIQPVAVAPSGETSASGPERIFCGARFNHGLGAAQMPGAVRWKWVDDDEKTWIRCPEGCCPIM